MKGEMRRAVEASLEVRERWEPLVLWLDRARAIVEHDAAARRGQHLDVIANELEVVAAFLDLVGLLACRERDRQATQAYDLAIRPMVGVPGEGWAVILTGSELAAIAIAANELATDSWPVHLWASGHLRGLWMRCLRA
jgi:hypothetical protein